MSSDQTPKDSLRFENTIEFPWTDVIKAVWVKYPNKKIPQVLWEKVIDIEQTEAGFAITKLKQSYKGLKWIKIFSLVTYDFKFSEQILNYREEVVHGLTKGLFKPLEISRYSGKDSESVEYIKTYLNQGSFIRMKASFFQKHKEGLEILQEIIWNRLWESMLI